MDDQPDTQARAGQPRSRGRRRRRLLVGTGVLVAAVGWFGYTSWRVYDGLQDARAGAESAVNALLAGDAEAAREAVTDADSSAARAVAASESVTWRTLRAVPGLGRPFETVHEIAEVVHGLTRDVATPTVDAGAAFTPDNLIASGGRVNVDLLRDAVPVLENSAAAAQPIAARARDIPASGYVSTVDDARLQVQDLTARLARTLQDGTALARVAPGLLGADGPRNYFLAFQTPAEARGTGGLVGGFGILQAEDGTVGIDALASNNDVPYWKTYQPVDLGPDFAATYSFSETATTDIRNSNFSPHFPNAGRIWQSLWEQESGQRVDGAVATDPIALSYVLEATGPVTLANGEVVDAGNIVELTMSSNYLRFADDNDARKAYLQQIAQAVVAKMTGRIEAPDKLMEALARAIDERRIAVWSNHPEEQEVLADSPIGHTVADTDSPYAEVVINNHAGNKMDYYLHREIEYRAESCTAGSRRSTVTVRLTNTAPDDVVAYPDYVAGAVDGRYDDIPKGSNLPMITLVGTRGAQLGKVTVDGNSTFPFRGTEIGHPVFHVRAAVPRGESVEVVFELTEPSAPGAPQVPLQPLVDEPVVTVDVPVCGA